MSTNKVLTKQERGLGRSATAAMENNYPGGNDVIGTDPGYDPESTFQESLSGVNEGNDLTGNVNMDYEHPDLPEITQFVPNVRSPGPGSDNPEDQGEAPPPPPSSGRGSTTSPSETSPKVAQQKIGDLISGKSFAE